MRFFIALCLCMTVTISYVTAISEHTDDKNGDGKMDTWIEAEGDDIYCLSVDSNYDGSIDYILRTTGDNVKVYEEIDFNHDGNMDDFYFYSEGMLARRELDSNYDGDVDIWVFLYKGLYIEKYLRDTDFDGTVDLEKDYSPEEGS